MTVTERLAREIRRVTELRCQFGLRRRNSTLDVIDSALEAACRAIGSGDEGRMTAAGLILKDIE